MPGLIDSTSEEIRGPWLLSEEALLALDRVMSDELDRLRPHLQRKLNEDVEAELAYSYISEKNSIDEKRREIESRLLKYSTYNESREVVIYYSKKSKYEGHTFEEAIRKHELLAVVPNRFTAKYRSGEFAYGVEIREVSKKLTIETRPEGSPEAKEIYTALYRWATKYQSPKWQQWWFSLNGLQWVLWLFVLFLSTLILPDTAKETYRNQARQLLQGGISQEEVTKSIEVILALETDYSPPGSEFKFPIWFKIIFFAGFVVCLASSFAPKSTLGIGQGPRRIKLTRAYTRIIIIGIPSFIIINIIMPIIVDRYLKK